MIKVNYNLEMKNVIASLENKPLLVLHSCCAPCSSSVIEKLIEHFKIVVVYYNPNIYPATEYQIRKNEQQNYIKMLNNKDLSFVELDYDTEKYQQDFACYASDKEGGMRCHECYKMRMEKICQYAKNINADFFCTTLTVSPYKNADFVNQIGQQLEAKYAIKFLPSDFKKENGYLRSIEISKQQNFYRQNYCGCKFSIRNKLEE